MSDVGPPWSSCFIFVFFFCFLLFFFVFCCCFFCFFFFFFFFFCFFFVFFFFFCRFPFCCVVVVVVVSKRMLKANPPADANYTKKKWNFLLVGSSQNHYSKSPNPFYFSSASLVSKCICQSFMIIAFWNKIYTGCPWKRSIHKRTKVGASVSLRRFTWQQCCFQGCIRHLAPA